MLFSKKAQSIIEYTLVILLVAAGLIVARPYVIRAINAHMKSWNDATQDSMRDTLRTAEPPVFTCPCSGNWQIYPGCCVTCGSCHDGVCCHETGENISGDPQYCPDDCGIPPCPDGTCGAGEDITNCPQDCCSAHCGGSYGCDASCQLHCPAQCPPSPCNGDGDCDPGENIIDCPSECCPGQCGDGSCETHYCHEDSQSSAYYCWCDCHCGNHSCETTIPGGTTCTPVAPWPEAVGNCSDCVPANPCAAVTDAACRARGSGSCCNDACCSRCYVLGSWGACRKRPAGYGCNMNCQNCNAAVLICSPP